MALSDILSAQKIAANKATFDRANFESTLGQLNKLGIIDPNTLQLRNTGEEGGAIGMQKLLEANDMGMSIYGGLIADIMNSNEALKNSIMSEVKDENGKVISQAKQRKLKVHGFGKNPDGSFSLLLDSPQGIVPKTFGFSDAPDDYVMKLSPSETESLINTAIGMGLGKYKPGTITGDAIFEASQKMNEVEQDIEDGKISVAQGAEVLTSLAQIIEQNKDPNQVNAANTTSVNAPAVNDAEFQTDITLDKSDLNKQGAYVLDTRDPKVQEAKTKLSGIAAGTILSDNEIDLISNGLSEGFRAAWVKNYSFNQKQLELTDAEIARLEGIENKTRQEENELRKLQQRRDNVQIPRLQTQLDRVKQNIEEDTVSIQAAEQKKIDEVNKKIDVQKRLLNNPRLSPAKRANIEETITELEKGLTSTQPSTKVSTGPQFTALPSDPKEIQGWYDTNIDSIKQLAQDKQEEIKKLIAENPEINTVDDLGKLKGKADPQAVAAVLASQSPYVNNIDEFAKLWGGITNALATGSPDTTALDVAKFQRDVRKDKFEIEKYFKELSDTGEKAAANLMDEFNKLLFDEKGGYKKLTAEDRNKLRANFVKLSSSLSNIQGGKGLPYEKNILGNLFKAAVTKEGSVDLPDWIADVFAGNDPNNLGVLVDQARVRTKKITGRDGKEREVIDEIYFVDAAGNETEGSLKQPELIKYFGPQGTEIRARLLSLLAKQGK
jgi:hypothetical protein